MTAATEWRMVNVPLRDFKLEVGMVIEVQEDDELKQYLIGDYTTDTSSCHGCRREYDTSLVVRMRRLNWRTE